MHRACPDDDQMARFMAGQLFRSERELMEAHLDVCRDCADLAVSLARFHQPGASSIPPRPPAARPPAAERPQGASTAVAASVLVAIHSLTAAASWDLSRPFGIVACFLMLPTCLALFATATNRRRAPQLFIVSSALNPFSWPLLIAFWIAARPRRPLP